MAAQWCDIESDPGVFTELIEKIGVKDVQMEEVFSLGDLEGMEAVYGLIFLFKWTPDQEERPVDHSVLGDMFFARQVITNACATQAILSVLLNSPDIDVGPSLGDFKGFAGALDPESAGEAINSLDAVRIAHNSFSRPEPFISDGKGGGKPEDVFHFIAYIPFKGSVYELDGLKQGPIKLGEFGDSDWLAAVRPHIEARIEKYAGNEIRFNLMSVIKDQRVAIQEQIEKREQRIKDLEGALAGESPTPDATFQAISIKDDEKFKALLDSNDGPSVVAQLKFEQSELAVNKNALETKKQVFQQWKEENIRRKHNYVPLCTTILRLLAEHGKLTPMIEQAKTRHEERIAAQNKAKQQG